MDFKEKLEKQFSDLKIGKPDFARHHYHLYADYTELIALITNTFVTQTDIFARLFHEGIDVLDGFSFDNDETELDNAEKNDRNELWIHEIFDIIAYRSGLYSTDYPFEITKKGLILKKELSPRNNIYLSLLISSALNIFSLVKHELTSEFEYISYKSLLCYMPGNSIVKLMRKKPESYGTAKDKINRLADELNIDINRHEISHISDKNLQEKGLDLVAWIPFEDKIPNLIIILGQCACGKNWDKKQYETGRYENYFNFYKQKPIHALFVPYALTNEYNSFFQSDDIVSDRIIFDRKRILEYLHDAGFFESLNTKQIVERCISFEEDII